MKSWCLVDHATGRVFKVIVTEEQLKEYFDQNPNISECVDCIECDDADSITLE